MGFETRASNSWWTSISDSKEKKELMIDTETGSRRIPFEDKLKILGFTLNPQGKTQDCLEERMQNANKAWWRDVQIYRNKDVLWRVKYRRMVEHVCSVFLFWKRKLVLESCHCGQNYEIGD